MPEALDVKEYATSLKAQTLKRHPKETFALPIDRLHLLLDAVISGAPATEAAKPALPDVRPVANPKEETIRMLQMAEGPVRLDDLRQALGHGNTGPTTTMIRAMVKAGAVTYDETTKEVRLAKAEEAA